MCSSEEEWGFSALSLWAFRHMNSSGRPMELTKSPPGQPPEKDCITWLWRRDAKYLRMSSLCCLVETSWSPIKVIKIKFLQGKKTLILQRNFCDILGTQCWNDLSQNEALRNKSNNSFLAHCTQPPNGALISIGVQAVSLQKKNSW